MEHVKNEFVIRARHMYEPLSLTHSIWHLQGNLENLRWKCLETKNPSFQNPLHISHEQKATSLSRFGKTFLWNNGEGLVKLGIFRIEQKLVSRVIQAWRKRVF
jgi:hypothetical protein